MAIRMICDMALDGVCYHKNAGVTSVKEHCGITDGMELSKGTVVGIFLHHESRKSWAIIRSKTSLYEIDLPYDEGDLNE